MPEYLHPGVYIEETSFRSPPMEGVSTSTAGLVGRTRKGREGRPTLVTSFTQFVREFGQPFPVTNGAPIQLGDHLGHAVRAFFDNGGKRAYIVRALAFDAKAAEAELEQGIAYLLPPTMTVRGPTNKLQLVSVRGLVVGAALQAFTRDSSGNATPLIPLTVDSVDVTRNTITVTPGIPPGMTLSPGSTFFTNGNAPAAGGPRFTAKSRGAGGNEIAVQIRPSDVTPARLVARRFFRTSIDVATWTGAGTDVGPGAVGAFSLEQFGAVAPVPGDTIAFSGPDAETVEVDNVTFTGAPPLPTTVAITVVTSGSAAGGDPVTLVSRRVGATDVTAPTAGGGIVLHELGAAVTVAAADTTLSLPYELLASLQQNDVIALGSAEVRIGANPNFNTRPHSIDLVGSLTSPHPATTASIVATSDYATNTRRLLVGDLTGLVTPYPTGAGAAFQRVAISDGTNVVEADVLLVDPLKRAVYVRANAVIPDAWTSFELLDVAGAGQHVEVSSTASFYTGAIVELFDGAQSTVHTVDAIDPGARRVTLAGTVPSVILPADATQRTASLRTLEVDVLISENGVLLETFGGLTWNSDATKDSFRRYYVARINDSDTGSQLVSVMPPGAPTADLAGQPTTHDGFPRRLGTGAVFVTGSDGSALGPTDLTGSDDGPGRRFGIEALKERKDIALVAVPGVTDEIVQQALLAHCEQLKYRFAILDGRRGVGDITQIQSHRANYDSKYGGYYVPWLQTVDLVSGATITVPPSGHVLGICARVDNERGVHKAPANEVVRNVLDVELPFTDGEQDVLNPVGINLIRELEGRGIRVWGARTTTSDQEWKYVNVRRLFIFLEHSIDNGTQWVVFEPNNEALWERVKESIESFLFGVWKTGALMGTKPEEAYFVRCDRTTMTQDDIDNGRLVCLIGVAPAYPAEFVIFRIGQFTASSNRA